MSFESVETSKIFLFNLAVASKIIQCGTFLQCLNWLFTFILRFETHQIVSRCRDWFLSSPVNLPLSIKPCHDPFRLLNDFFKIDFLFFINVVSVGRP